MASKTAYVASSAALGVGGTLLGMGLAPALPIAFAAAAAPAILGVTGTLLPAAWKLLETIPPKPQQVEFPAIRLVFEQAADDKQNITAPLWQKLLGTSILAALALAAADPRLESASLLEKNEGPVLLVVDNDWSAARDWDAVQRRMQSVLESADRQGRKVMILPTAPDPAAGVSLGPLQPAEEALSALPALEPHPWPADRAAALEALKAQGAAAGASILWFSNGEDGGRAGEFLQALENLGNVSVLTHEQGAGAHLLSLAEGEEELKAFVHRLQPGAPETRLVTAIGAAGEVLAQQEAQFSETDLKAAVSFDLPAELRRQIVKLALPGESHAGAVVLLDESWRKRKVGLLNGAGAHSLLSDSYFLSPALSPFTDLSAGGAGEILRQKDLSALVMTDGTVLSEDERAQMQEWIGQGGMLLRFAGPRLAAQPEDSLTPVPLMRGENHTGGTFSGSGSDSGLAEFPENSPLAGLPVPQDFNVKTRILPEAAAAAEPGTEIWAEFNDGVPFISAKKQGQGWVVLVHSAANLEWSNLPLSDDFFLDMMKSLIGKSKSAGASAELAKPLPPLNVLDAAGRLGPAGASHIALTRERAKEGHIGPDSPPGFYGESSIAKRAHNLYSAVPDYKALAVTPGGKTTVTAYQENNGPDKLTGMLLFLAISLFLADLAARLHQSGRLSPRNIPAREPEI